MILGSLKFLYFFTGLQLLEEMIDLLEFDASNYIYLYSLIKLFVHAWWCKVHALNGMVQKRVQLTSKWSVWDWVLLGNYCWDIVITFEVCTHFQCLFYRSFLGCLLYRPFLHTWVLGCMTSITLGLAKYSNYCTHIKKINHFLREGSRCGVTCP